MPKVMQDLIEQYIEAVKKIYGSHVRQIILYGSYARGDFRSDLDVDIMILLDLSDLELKAYRQQLSYMTYGEMFVAALLAAAYAESNVVKLIETGLGEIPATSRLYEVVLGIVSDYCNGVSKEKAINTLIGKRNGMEITNII